MTFKMRAEEASSGVESHDVQNESFLRCGDTPDHFSMGSIF